MIKRVKPCGPERPVQALSDSLILARWSESLTSTSGSLRSGFGKGEALKRDIARCGPHGQ